ncbi:hypothetical protein N646_0628 [Vibrio alginolyticus NBRC 15630 = ATCC 17749]|uniref:Uncharacterized protein n=1 Tax=Vibrio alginolyticus (strain ATCC 17749 / DSM 2171 / NBRC 15630 / NCIMB 1903 / NCTC 12160 / XII-53) TaxID=1219076 RepID=A0A2I3C489_VIBAX|nr:hypothetical protein N646_0628 [Vibrio alginolyticus NBRC 15630 = ATCC 17749]
MNVISKNLYLYKIFKYKTNNYNQVSAIKIVTNRLKAIDFTLF